MNVKQGDIALWVTRGVLVEVLRPSVGGARYRSTCGRHIKVLMVIESPAWDVRVLGLPQWSRGVPKSFVFVELPVYDSVLRPLRDNPGEDETLRYAGKPADNMRKEVQALTDKLNAALERLRQVERREGQGA